MTYHGRVENGKVVILGNRTLPEGADVEFSILKIHVPESGQAPCDNVTDKDLLLNLAGVIHDLPADASENIDHYLYGAPKR